MPSHKGAKVVGIVEFFGDRILIKRQPMVKLRANLLAY
jgi:hypothetical protein